MELEGKNVVVTGGSQGIGEAMAAAFSAEGCNVLVVARSETKLAAVAERIGGRFLVADLLDPGSVDRLVGRCLDELGPVDIWVNNAGLETIEAFVEVEPQRIRDVAQLNLEAPMMLSRLVLPHMLQRGSGHIVNISSLAGTIAWPGLAAFCGTKGGLTNFTETVRMELADTGVDLTLVAPGPVMTEMWRRLESDDAPYVAGALRRFRLLGFLPRLEPPTVAGQVVRAVAKGKPYVRPAARYQLYHALNNAPRRIVRLALFGTRTPPLDLDFEPDVDADSPTTA